MTAGIYRVTHIDSQLSYIGQSKNIEKRFMEHRRGGQDSKFHKYVSKYGPDAFVWEIIAIETDSDRRNRLEIAFIKHFEQIKLGLNLRYGGIGGCHGDETRKKISDAQLGRPLSEEAKRKLSEFWKGKPKAPRTKEHAEKIATQLRGRKLSDEQRAQRTEQNYKNHAKRTPDERKAIAAKTWATRRERYGENGIGSK
ncbi:GIY-YIG nuclease family protein [Brucella anthropi]|uniref:GIY-YIG nuclease family protein n=1 Tax=Brucella anthropi TaxID=529 RepID=UPI0021665946|nr:GIY-YIG nuclease family protein [Brucella anthropi]UVV67090.1 GIY-YIG nuclease family protein [Brucella anthropi]